MLIFTLRRLNLLIFTLLILSLLAYWIEYRLGAGDQSLWAGYLQFLKRLLAGDLGVSSQSGQPILQTIMGYLPATLELSLLALRPACKLSASTLLEPTVGVVFSALTVTACSVLSCAIAAKGRAMMRAHKGRSAGARER